MVDVELDSTDPGKRNRPLIAGKITKIECLVSVILMQGLIIYLTSILPFEGKTIYYIGTMILIHSYIVSKYHFPDPQLVLLLCNVFSVFYLAEKNLNNLLIVLIYSLPAYLTESMHSAKDINSDLKFGVFSSAITYGKMFVPILFFVNAIVTICSCAFSLSDVSINSKLVLLLLNVVNYTNLFRFWKKHKAYMSENDPSKSGISMNSGLLGASYLIIQFALILSIKY